MSLLQDSQIENSVYLCSFQCNIRQANISMKFPCSYFVEWSTSSRKAVATSSKHLPQQQVVQFDQKLILSTQMVYNNKTSQYSKKETLVQLYLVSKSRPDQNKLVGRVSIDLAKVINFQMYAEPTQFTLNFCSVQGSITMQFHLIDQKLTTMKMHDLDKSSFIDFISQIAMKTPKSNSAIKTKQPIPRQRQSSTISQDIAQLKMSLRNDISDLQQNITNHYPLGSHSRINSKLSNQKVESKIEAKQSNVQSSNIQIRSHYERPMKQYTESKMVQNGVDLEEVRPKVSFKSKILEKDTTNDRISNQEKITPPSQVNAPQPTNSINQVPIQRQKVVQVRDDKQKALQLQKNLRDQQNNRNIEDAFLQVLHEDHKIEIESLQQQKNMLQKLVVQLQHKQQGSNQLIQHLKQQLDTKNNIIKQLQAELNQKDTRCEQLLHMIQSLSQQNNQKEQQQQSMKLTEKEYIYLQETIKKFQFEIKQLNGQLQQAQKREILDEKKFCNLQQLIKTLEFQNDNCKDELRNQLQMRQALESKVTEYEDLLKQLTNMNKEKQQKLTQSQSNHQKVKNQLQNLEQQHKSLVNQLNLQIEALKQELSKTNQISLIYQNQRQEYVQLCSLRQTQILELKLLVEQYKAKEVNTSRTVQIVQNTEKIVQLEEQNRKISEQVQFLKQNLQMLERQSNQEIELLKVQKNKLQISLEKLQMELHKLKSQHEERQNNDMQRQTGMQQILSRVNEEINAYREELSNTNNELAIQKQYNEEMIFEIKSLQNEKNSLYQQLEKYQTQIVQLHQQLRDMGTPQTNKNTASKEQNCEEKIHQYQMRISKLNSNLQEQINQNNQLSQTIVNYMQKQAKMKQTLNVLEQESKEIFVLFQEKQHNEETYQKMIEDLQKQIQRLSTNFYQIHSQELSPIVSPKKSVENSPTLQKLKQKWQFNNNEQLTQTIRKLQQLNQQLNEQLLKLKIMYNRLKQESETQIKKLNEQILEVSNTSKKDISSQKNIQLEKSIKNKDFELQITKSKLRQAEQAKIKLQKQFEEVKRQMEALEEQKFNIESAHNEKDIKILQLEEELVTLKKQTKTHEYQYPKSSSKQNQQFLSLLSLVKQKLTIKNIHADWEQMIQNILQKSLCGQDTSKLINIQQKSRLLSKQLQKLKAHILKSALRNQQEKLSFLNLIKTCESIVVEIIAAAESLSLNQSSFL